ncbi:amino acid adenylation domain-containing protein [Streptomyces sp. NBC_00104]|uniref:amino acid adenylation domain-containing protein n=1 Tax=Streptomyces sp. NBC_00104 TaxID=2903621 RepID=UPI00325542AB
MSDNTRPVADSPLADAWLVGGPADVPALRTRLAAQRPQVTLTVHDLTGVADESAWGELVREEVAAARADTGHARVLLGRLTEKRFLLVVVTAAPLPPAAVMRWLFTPGSPFPRAGAGDVAAPLAAELPAALRSGGSPSGVAATVHIPAGPVADRLRAAGMPAEAALAAAVNLLLARYGGPEESRLLLAGADPAAVSLRVDETLKGTALLRRAERAVDAGTPVPAQTRATLAVAPGGRLGAQRVGDRTVAGVRLPDAVARHGLLVLLDPDGDGLRVDYDTGLFEPDAVAAFAARLPGVLQALLGDTPVHDIDAPTGAERAALQAWSRGPARPVEEVCLHTLVEQCARRTPDAVAVVCGDTELTYRELDFAANRVAHRLRAEGIGPGRLVALLTERAAQSVVAMLGVLKSGAAYVPIEPTYPAERIRHILRDAGADALLAPRPPEADVPVPVLLPADMEGLPGHCPGVRVSPDDTAYVIYTSGSTGVPKGIAVHHGAIVASTAARAAAGPAPGRDLVLPPLCFDGAAGGMYWALTGGGTVVLPTEKEAHDPIALLRLLERADITHVHAVPSHYRIVLQVADATVLSRFAMVAVGGEQLTPETVAEHLRHCPDAPLFNDYGPTECAVWATTHRCGPAEPAGAGIPIGRPVPNYRAYVLDARLRPVPPGVPGEIYLGGPAVAHGYHRRPALTAERFLPDPFEAGRRLYRTGDRGLWSPGGRLHILGRVDHQVKVRGFRIELGEVEAALRRHPAVADCTVLLRQEKAGERLVAFVALDTEVADAELRRKIAETLPDAMRPDHIEVLPALPRTAGGKVDALALRSMAIAGR